MFEHQVYAPTTGTNGFMPLDTDEHEEETGGNYYYIDLGTVVNQMKRYSCTCLSGQNCKTHSKAEASQKILVPLRRTNGLTSIRSSKVQIDDEKAKVEGETQKKKELEKENFRKWLLEKAKQKEDQAKREKEKLLRKKREAEEKKKLRKAEGELRYKLWLKEKERENLESKIREQLQILTVTEKRQKRLQKSEQAYQDWLLKSATKSKPVPQSKGLESLKSSTCCVFMNPKPWIKDESRENA